jgi:hypothetical protein
MPTFKLDGVEIPFEAGDTIIRAAWKKGVEIPHLLSEGACAPSPGVAGAPSRSAARCARGPNPACRLQVR